MRTILLIENDLDILENFAEYFVIEGYKVLATDNGEKGVELATKFKPDLIICDFLMPGMSGQKVLEMILNTDRTKEIPFIFSTSLSEKIDEMNGLNLGADAYIVKPFDPDNLLELAVGIMNAGSKRRPLTPS
jgi:DNA-binding response OmpR family regulator